MVEEIECPYCRSRIIPKSRFSLGTFLTLLILGVLPFALSVFSIINLIEALRWLPKEVPKQSPIIMPPEFTPILNKLPLSMFMSLIAFLILSLIVGLIPAVVYLATRRDSYKCPLCELTIS